MGEIVAVAVGIGRHTTRGLARYLVEKRPSGHKIGLGNDHQILGAAQIVKQVPAIAVRRRCLVQPIGAGRVHIIPVAVQIKLYRDICQPAFPALQNVVVVGVQPDLVADLEVGHHKPKIVGAVVESGLADHKTNHAAQACTLLLKKTVTVTHVVVDVASTRRGVVRVGLRRSRVKLLPAAGRRKFQQIALYQRHAQNELTVPWQQQVDLSDTLAVQPVKTAACAEVAVVVAHPGRGRIRVAAEKKVAGSIGGCRCTVAVWIGQRHRYAANAGLPRVLQTVGIGVVPDAITNFDRRWQRQQLKIVQQVGSHPEPGVTDAGPGKIDATLRTPDRPLCPVKRRSTCRIVRVRAVKITAVGRNAVRPWNLIKRTSRRLPTVIIVDPLVGVVKKFCRTPCIGLGDRPRTASTNSPLLHAPTAIRRGGRRSAGTEQIPCHADRVVAGGRICTARRNRLLRVVGSCVVAVPVARSTHLVTKTVGKTQHHVAGRPKLQIHQHRLRIGGNSPTDRPTVGRAGHRRMPAVTIAVLPTIPASCFAGTNAKRRTAVTIDLGRTRICQRERKGQCPCDAAAGPQRPAILAERIGVDQRISSQFGPYRDPAQKRSLHIA